jgi:Big-like domain-containing protein
MVLLGYPRSSPLWSTCIPGSSHPPYGVSGTSQFLPKLAIFSGNANRTLSYSNLSTNQCPGPVAVADFNGDGINDLAYSEASCTTASTSNFVIRPGTGSGGFGAEQTVYQNTYRIYQPYTVRSTTGTKPDLTFVEDLGPNNTSTNPPEALVLLSNTSAGSFPGCGVTGMAVGIRICTPGATAGSPVKFSVGAAGPTPMRTAAVWVDGKKADEQLVHAFSNYSFFDGSLSLAAGSHAITIYGTGWDDTLQKKSFTLTVSGSGGSCSAPTSPGVHVCAPANGSTVSSPVQVQATAMITGTLARMELWVDGVKKYTETSSKTLNTSISLGAGSHRFGVFAVNTAGTKWEGVATATVK